MRKVPGVWTVPAVAVAMLVICMIPFQIALFTADVRACGDQPQPGCGVSTATIVGWATFWLLAFVALPSWLQWRLILRRRRQRQLGPFDAPPPPPAEWDLAPSPGRIT